MGLLRNFALQTLSPLLLLPSSLLATIIRVPQDQPNIQAGINAAVNGDTVLVAPGTYPVNLNFNGKNIFLKSDAGPEVTILTPASNGTPILRVMSGEDTTATIDGFRFLRGNAPNGGGILFNNSSGTVVNNIFDSCTAIGGTSGNGGGVACIGAFTKVRISSNIFKNGQGGSGSGQADAVFCLSSSVEISRNLFTNNSSSAVIYVYTSSNVRIINNTIANTSSPGNALSYQDGAVGDVRNNIFFNNPGGGMINLGPVTVTVEYNDFFISPTSGSPLGVGNISLDPLFLGGVPFNYELTQNSPCIDAGDPSTPVPPRGGARVDIGALEFTNIGLISPGNDERVLLRQPQFIWTRIRDTAIAATYRIVLDTVNSFATADSSPPFTDTTWRFPYYLKLRRSYFWKVFAVPDTGDTFFTGVRTFTVSPFVILKQPVDSSRVLVKQPVFTWQAVRDTSIPDAFSYRVAYANNPSFAAASVSPLLSDTSWQPPFPLAVGYTYYWRVLAFYSNTPDTVLPGYNYRFLLAPTKLEVPLDRPTIQQAIDISLNGDTILVSPGTYVQNILFRGKKIKVLSQGGPDNTTLAKLVDGAPLVTFSGSEDSNAVLSGFTIRGARLAPNGAGISMINASPIVENNYFFDNAGDSAVIYVRNGTPKIRRNLIAGNNTDLCVLGFFSGAGGQVINNTLAKNTGDGVRITPAMGMQIINNIITLNSGYGIRTVGGVNSSSTIGYNDIYGDSLGTYFAAIPTYGDIYEDPQFVGGNPFDYHLSSGSPCIDAGDPSFPAPPGGGAFVDMGAFEFSGMRGDLNQDGTLSPTDVVLELNCAFLLMGDCNLGMADLNCDGSLSPTDVVLMLNAVFAAVPLPC